MRVIQLELRGGTDNSVDLCKIPDLSNQYFIIIRRFLAGVTFNLSVTVHFNPEKEPIVQNCYSPHFEITKFSFKRMHKCGIFKINLRFSPFNLSKYTHEIGLKGENGAHLHIVFLALSEPLKICGPTKTLFPRCLVNDISQKLVIFNSDSQTPLEYKATVFGPFSIQPSHGFICDKTEACLLVTFTPKSIYEMGGLLIFVCENGEECVCELSVEVYEVEIGLSASSVTVPSVLIGTHGYTKVALQNFSDQTVKFNWKLEKHVQNISLQPMIGILNPQTEREIVISYNPNDDSYINTAALCIVTGRQNPLKVKINGCGKAPNIEFSTTQIDAGSILVTTPRTFELVLHNKSEIEAVFAARMASEYLSVSTSEGIINANGYQSILITIQSNNLGHFEEELGFEFVGTSKTHFINISGTITAPEIISEPKYLDFGDVAYDFGVSKVLKILNNSSLRLPIKFQIIEMEGIVVSKSEIFLEDQATISVQLNYLASEEGFKEGSLDIIMESVGKILEIPIRARCCVPRIEQKIKRIKLDSCFMNHPKKCQIPIENPTGFSAKYHFFPVETDHVKIIPFASSGILPSKTTTFINFDLIGRNVGNLEENMEITIVGAEYKPLNFEIICECVGPILSLCTKCEDFGEIQILDSFKRIIEISNISPVPAKVNCFTMKKSTHFEVFPHQLTIPPFAKELIEITAFVKFAGIEATDVLEISTENASSPPWKVDLRAIGIGDLVSIVPELGQTLELGQQFVTLPQIYEFTVKNCSFAQQRLVWTIENIRSIRREKKQKTSKKEDFKILLNPPKFEVKSSQCVKMSLKITSSSPQKIQFTLQCFSVLANKGHKKLLRECRVSAEFIEPMISIIPNPIEFVILKELGKDIKNQYQSISITNEADIETSVNLAISKPLFIFEDGIVSQNLGFSVNGKELRDITIGHTTDKTHDKYQSYSVSEQLNISFLNHPLKMKIPVSVEVYFPTLQIKEKNIDFGTIENGTFVTKSIVLHNDSPIEAKYEWKLTNGLCKDNPREPLRMPIRSKSLEVINTSNSAIRRCSSISIIDSVHFKDVFSVSPALGLIKPGESMLTNFTFVGHHNLSAKCIATCKIIDGIDQEIDLTGQSSTSDCYITAKSISFADILFSKEATQIFRIYNAGKVPSPYYFTCDENDLNLKIDPPEGEVPAKGVAEVTISLTVPRSQEFNVFAKLHLTELTPKTIRIYGKACFPHYNFKSPILSGINYTDSHSCEFVSSLTTNLFDYPIKLPTSKLHLSDIFYGEIKTAKIEYEQKNHNFDVEISIDKSVKRHLAENGVTVNIGREINVTFDSSKNKMGEIIFDIPLKIHEKIIQPIQLYANIFPPELKVTPTKLDFGEVYLNEAKIIAVQLHNPTPCELSWALPGTERSGKSFKVQPKYGKLNPDQKENIFIKFHPRIGDTVKEEINVQVQESGLTVTISCQGHGLEQRLIFKPKRIEFKPLKPNEDYDEKTLVIRNPCDFEVEFYSADFDPVHIQEEKLLTSFPLFQESEELLIPPRKPGDELPKEIYDSFAQMQKVGSGKMRSSRLRSSRRGLTKPSTDSTKSPQFSSITTFKKFVEESCLLPTDPGIAILVFGSPQSGKSNLARRLAEIYDASYLDIQEFLETHTQDMSLEGSLVERIQQDDCKFGLIVDNLESVKSCELVLRCLGKGAVKVFAVTVIRDIESIQLADKHYEEGLKKAEKEAFDKNVKKYMAMAEWEYDSLSKEEREIVDQTLAKWKRQQQKRNEIPNRPVVETNVKKKPTRRKRGMDESTLSEDPEMLKYAELEQRIIEFKKESRMISELLSTWDLLTHEQSPNKTYQQPINLDLSESSFSAKSHEEPIGIPHFLIQSKLDCELQGSIIDQIIVKHGEVVMEKPNISVVVNKLLPNLPSPEEIRQNLGYGPLEFKIPDPITYEVVSKPTRSEELKEKTIFTISNPPGIFEAVKTMETPRSSSRLSAVTQSGRSISRNSSSKEKKLVNKSTIQYPEEVVSYRWIVPANGRIEVTIRFSPPEQGIYKDVLRFALARTNSCFLVECEGCCNVPGLITDPKVEERCPADRFPRKSYILERNRFEFGPLLASKPRDKILAGEYKENFTELQLKNEEPHDVEVTFSFNENETGSFVVTPSKLRVLNGETKAISVFALPNSVSHVTGALIGKIKDNPETIVFYFTADGVLPNLSIQTKSLDFGRLPLNYTGRQTISIYNPSVIPISWKVEKMETIKDVELNIYPTSGILRFLNETAGVTVKYTAPSIPEKILSKKALRFIVTDTRELSDPIVIQPYVSVQAEAVDPNFEIGLLKGGIDFGLLKFGDTARKSIELRNGGPYKLRYKLIQNQLKDFQYPFTLSSYSGSLQPGQNTLINISCTCSREMDIRENIFTCEVETYSGIPIESVPITITAQIRRSQFKLFPSNEIAFGAITTNTKISEHLFIENNGPFDLRYSIAPKISTKHSQSNSRRVQPSAVKSGGRLSLGPFTIHPVSGIISIGKKIEIQVDCSAGSVPSSYDEELTINISDKTTTNEISYRLSVEIIAPILKFENKLTIFEEHLICKRRKEFEILTSNNVSNTAYIEDENCFDFGVSQLETISKGKFKIFNNSKIPIDVGFHIQCNQSQNHRKNRRSHNDELDVFEVVPSQCCIEPFQSVYLSICFTPKSLQTFYGNLQALVKGQNSDILLFGIQGRGIIPRICVVEPSRNSNGEYLLEFNGERKSNLIELKNDGLIPCEVSLNIEETGGDINFFKFNEDIDSKSPEGSPTIELGIGETRSLDIVLDATKCQSNEEIKGTVNISVKGNTYEKFGIKLLGKMRRKFTTFGPIEIFSLESESDKQHLSLGSCCVGTSICRSFLLNYPEENSEPTERSSYYFNWVADIPNLELEPKSGELKPGSSVSITAKFQCDEPIKYYLTPIRCELSPLSNLKISEKGDIGDGEDITDDGAITARSAVTRRSQSGQSPKLRSKSALPRSNYSLGRRKRVGSKQLPVIEDENTTEEKEVEKLLLDILFSVTCGYVEYECSADVIEFSKTPLHCESVHTLQIKNTGVVKMFVSTDEMLEGPFWCEISECVINPGQSHNVTLKYRPTKCGINQETIILRIPNAEDESSSIKKIQLLGEGCSVPIYLQLAKSDYQPKSLPNDLFWNGTQTLELTTVGIGSNCVKSFSIKNTSEESVEIKINKIKPDRQGGMEISLSENGLEPGCSSDVIVEFTSSTMEPEECFVIFEADGFRVPLIIVGHTREAIVAFNKSHIDFENVLVGRTVMHVVDLVNAEEIPINFKMDKTTLCCNESSDKLTISPLSGCLQPKEKLPIKIGFSPKKEGNCNYNIICKVSCCERPIRLNVKTSSLKYFASGWILGEGNDPKLCIRPQLENVYAKDISRALSISTQKLINSPALFNNLPTIDFGEVFAGCEHTRVFELFNQSEFEINFGSSINKVFKDAPEIFTISPNSGKIPPLKATLIEIKFSSNSIFKSPHQRTCFLGVISILNGPTFAIDLRGNITSNPVENVPEKLDFGACFIQQVGLGCVSRNLEIFNRSPDKSIYVTFASSTLPECKCDLLPQIIEPLSSVKTNITFSPLLCKKYEGNLFFQLNERVNIMTPVTGKGVKLDLEIQPGKLNVSQKGEKSSKVIECKKKQTSLVNLGDLTAFQSSRCIVSIINKTPVPFEISAAAILPKSKQLNEVHTEPSNNHKFSADIINMNFLKCQPFSLKTKSSDSQLQNSDASQKGLAAEIEIFFNPRGRPIDPFSEEVIVRIFTKSNPEKQIWIRGFEITGKCTAVSVVAETSTVHFGTLVVGCSLSKCVAVTNSGNKMARFIWNDKTLPKNILSIEPWKGYIRAGSSMNFKFILKPDIKNGEISLKDVTCNIEDSIPLKFAVFGTITAPSDSDLIKFNCPVRSNSTYSFTLSNPTSNWWSIKPVFNGSAWNGETVIEIPPKGMKDYVINYHPQSMTQNGVPQKGQVFIPLPNGKGLNYNLEGTAGPPEPIQSKTLVEFSRGRKFNLNINVPNWLPKLQRFSVSWKASDETNFTFAGSSYFDIPGSKSKSYVLPCFAKVEASAELKVIFTNQTTGEYQFAEFHIRSTKPKSEGVIEVKSPLRRTTIYRLEVSNPFNKETTIGLRSSLQELICPPEYKLRPLAKSKIKLEFKPWKVGKLKGILEVYSNNLGQSIYDLQLEALDPLPESPVKFRTGVGKAETTFVTICNPSQSRVIFTCEINDLAFHCDKSILVAANSSAQLAVTFEPTQLGFKEATLKVSSSQNGSFIFPLCGFATAPEPQGPFIISATSPTILKVKNVFPQPMEYKINMDNPDFLIDCNDKVVKPQEELTMNIYLKNQENIPSVHGTVVISGHEITAETSSKSPKPIEWVFYLKSS